jgi:hypothetical protein
LRPGGTLALRDDGGSELIYPRGWAWEAASRLLVETRTKVEGAKGKIGERLNALALQAGFVQVRAKAVYENHHDTLLERLKLVTPLPAMVAKNRDFLEQQEWSKNIDWDLVASELEAWARDEESIFART